MRFIPAAEINDPLPVAIGLSGGSGTGKTYSALRIARGMAEAVGGKGAPFGFIDTENRRGLHYREAFPEMQHLDFTAENDDGEVEGFTVERWLAVIESANRAGLPAVVIDSFSHAWSGVGGVLEEQAQVLDRLVMEAEKRANGRYVVERDKYSMLAWAEVKPRYRRLVDAIIRAKTNFVICTRAKPVMQKGFGGNAKNAFKAKHRRDDIPWNPETDADLMFELSAMMILDPAHPGCPVYQVKCADQFKAIFDPRSPVTEATGRAMAEWAQGGGNAQQQKQILDEAREAARGGKAAFTEFWNSETGKANRPLIKTILEDCQRVAQEADRAAQSSDSDDPFGGSDDGDSDQHGEERPSLTPEQEERIRQEIEQQHREAAEREGAQ
ncbi:AAA family ATPase [Tranquillimonas rosea]|uniref:AAA family ATPase n=1 Tax=Tranquillimonas rosea TaxID=641238 RepID=UPI003BADB4A4